MNEKETIEILRNRLDEKDDLLRKTLTVNDNLTRQLFQRDKQINDIKKTLDDMIANERTHLGHNALVQFKQTLE